jgi:hypothetical protein
MFEFAAAPWPKTLSVISLLGTAVIGAVGFFAWRAIPYGTSAPYAVAVGTLVAAVAPAVLFGAALFCVRGYELASGGLVVRRLLWSSRVELDGLTRAWADADAMCRSIRVWGNGGLFAFTGLYRNKSLGTYRVFVTDPARAVVLRLPQRAVVISPADPGAFLEALRMVRPQAEIGAAPAGAGR